MPFIKVKTSSGEVKFFYTISTPTSTNAKTIDKKIPTVLFLHSVYIAQEVFELQWEDPRIRRFNCVAVDMREHGYTTGSKVPQGYGQRDAANDVALVMDALKIPAYHIVAQSMGTIVALALAVYHPKKVLSMFLVSPLALKETADVLEGREEIAEYWKQGFPDGNPDITTLQDAVYGAMQFGFSNRMDGLSHALVARTYPIIVKTCSPKHFDIYDRMMGDFSNNRREYAPSELAKISGPVQLVHGGADIVYPLERAQTFLRCLQNAGVDVTLSQIPDAPHWACTYMSTAFKMNDMMSGFLERACKSGAPPIPEQVTSPWEGDLLKAGWEKEDD
ncbi:alpha/beta-hydrolase [Cylindrobasidium torrendii FP15055 ss-10]|uniref:Alpha/beta-hydrolase n=1 Tax=Cylindrobasidium torrendii FP15055 ss-10 TaxID=1314674 RepID=A0A0D7BAN6_9AGAR|nr:alpha/beta-hydrolase [Cylindrobasidium torrendii FP15055 ss-10]